MNILIKSLLVSLIVSVSAFAEHHRHNGQGPTDMPMGMMDAQQRESMHQHMLEMRSIMGKIQQEQDPEKRQQLMQAHMAAMQKGMSMMNPESKRPTGKKEKGMTMEQRMGMMEQRMGSMHMMMEQMMQHNAEREQQRLHQHKKH